MVSMVKIGKNSRTLADDLVEKFKILPVPSPGILGLDKAHVENTERTAQERIY